MIRFCSEKYSVLYLDLTWWTLIAMQCQGCIYVSTKKSYFIGLKKNSAIFANFCTKFSPLVLSSFQISTPYGAQGPCSVFNSISPSLGFFPLLFPIFWIKAIAKGCCVCATLLLAPVWHNEEISNTTHRPVGRDFRLGMAEFVLKSILWIPICIVSMYHLRACFSEKSWSRGDAQKKI